MTQLSVPSSESDDPFCSSQGQDDPQSATFFDLMREFVKTDSAIKSHEDEVDMLKKRREHLQKILDMEFVKNGLQNVNVDGKTVFRRKDIRVWKKEGISTEAVCEALHKVGLSDLVKPGYNPSSLAAFVRELDRRESPEDRVIPTELAEVVDRVEQYSLVVKSSR